METLEQKKAAKEASLPYCEDENKVEAEKEAVGNLLKTMQRPGTLSAEHYEIPEAKGTITSLPGRIAVFLRGEDVYERTFKPSPIKRELRTIKDAIKRRLKEAETAANALKTIELAENGFEVNVSESGGATYWKHEVSGAKWTLAELFDGLRNLGDAEFRGKFGDTKTRATKYFSELREKLRKVAPDENGLVSLDKMDGLITDPVYTGNSTRRKSEGGPGVYVEFLRHYVKRVEENIREAISLAEKVRDLDSLEDKVFEKRYRIPKRKMLEEAHVEKRKKNLAQFAVAAGKELFSHDRLDTYKESKESMVALGKSYVYGKMMRNRSTHEIAGTERGLSEIFRGLHGLEEDEFRGKFGESKRRVVEKIGHAFYTIDVPKMYRAYLRDQKAIAGKMSDEDLRKSVSTKTYEEMVGNSTPNKLKLELREGVNSYIKEIDEVAALLPKEQLEEAREKTEARDAIYTRPLTQYNKTVRMEAKRVEKLKGLKTEKTGQHIDEYIEKYCKE